MKTIVFVMGSTCAGKTTAIDAACDEHGDKIRTCLIGKELRAKYPPEFFRGLAAMPETEPEVRAIFSQRLMEFMEDQRATHLLCDGIPRLDTQVDFILSEIRQASRDYDQQITKRLVLLTCNVDEIRRRAESRDTGAKLELTLQRITNDKLLGYETLVRLLQKGEHVYVYDTTNGFGSSIVL